VGMSSFPKFVTITNMISAEDLWKTLKIREENIRRDLKDNEALFMEYQAPSGQVLVIHQVAYYTDAEAMLLVGSEVGTDHECQVIAAPPTVQVMFRIATEEERLARKPIGFVVKRNEPEDDEEA
jgi:hypothetical protein